MKKSLDVNQQNALFLAFNQLDGYDTVAENGAKTVRVPYKLGSARRAVAKNMNALKASLTIYEEAHKALFKETFPDADENSVIKRDEADPAAFARFATEQKKIVEAKDEIELLPLPAAVLYGENEIPTGALAALEEHGLIEE